MDAKTLKERMTVDDVMKVMNVIGGEIYTEDDDHVVYFTICHGGDSPKLYLYKDSCNFHCYSECGQMDIITIVCNTKDYGMYEAIEYIRTICGISSIKYGFSKDEVSYDNDNLLGQFRKKRENMHKDSERSLPNFNRKLMNMFQFIPMSVWVDDGIDENIMRFYNIKYCTSKQSIIIPHYDINDNLVGIRQRYLLDEDVDMWGKYNPFYLGSTMYTHPLKLNLYGINMNKDTIMRKQKVLLVESEKGVLQASSMFGIDDNFTLALCGSSGISKAQINLLRQMGVREVILGLDRQYKEVGDEEYQAWVKKMRAKFIEPMLPYFNIYVIWDEDGLLPYKGSPTDVGKDTLCTLMKNKIYVSE